MKFKFHMFTETLDEFGKLVEKKEKDVEINAPSCCEAHVLATKGNRGWTVSSWESLDKSNPETFVPENKFEKEAWEKAQKMMAEEKKAAEAAKNAEAKANSEDPE